MALSDQLISSVLGLNVNPLEQSVANVIETKSNGDFITSVNTQETADVAAAVTAIDTMLKNGYDKDHPSVVALNERIQNAPKKSKDALEWLKSIRRSTTRY